MVTTIINSTAEKEIAGLVPAHAKAEEELLAEQLQDKGCKDPILVWKGRGIILDGRVRHRICEANGLKFETEEVDLPDLDAAKVFVAERQLGRRNLGNWGKAKLGLALVPQYAARAKERMEAGAKTDPEQNSERGAALELVGEKVGLSRDTLSKAREILERGSDEIKKALDEQTLSIHAAHKRMGQSVDSEPAPRAQRLLAKALTRARKDALAGDEGRTDLGDALGDTSDLTVEELRTCHAYFKRAASRFSSWQRAIDKLLAKRETQGEKPTAGDGPVNSEQPAGD
jgi:hypothetical protein